MIPERIDSYLRARHLNYEHLIHRRAVPAQQVAAVEHVSGSRVAKPVVVDLEGQLAIAVVSAMHRVDLEALARASRAAHAEVVPESQFAERFWPCEPGAEPPLGLFGLPIYVDAALADIPSLMMRGGTHEDAIVLDTREWLESERVKTVPGLGILAQ